MKQKKKKREKRSKHLSFQSPKLSARKFENHGHEVTYWATLLVILISNLLVSLVLVPVFLFLKTPVVYGTLAAFALVFGLFYTFLIHHIPVLELHHHLIGIIVLTTVAVLNIAVMVGIANGLSSVLRITQTQNPLVLGLLYGVTFLIPYAGYHAWKR